MRKQASTNLLSRAIYAMAEATVRATDRYIVIQWNDYRKENFLSFAGGFSSFEKAVEVQIKCLKEFQDNGWIKNVVHGTVPTSLVFPIRDLNRSSRFSSWLETDGGTNQFDRKFILVGCEGQMECFMASIYKVNPQRSSDAASKEAEEVYIETYWGGWGGLNKVFVNESIPPLTYDNFPEGEVAVKRLEQIFVDLTNPSKVQSEFESEHRSTNQRFDYEKKRCIHSYCFRYIPEVEYPILQW